MEQFGFRPGHSTELAAIRLVDYLMSEMDSNNTPLTLERPMGHICPMFFPAYATLILQKKYFKLPPILL